MRDTNPEALKLEQAEKAAALDHSRPIKFTRKSRNTEVGDKLLAMILEQILAIHPDWLPKQQRYSYQLKATLTAILLDLYTSWEADNKLYLGIPLNNNYYTANKHYLPFFISYKHVQKVIEALSHNSINFIKLETGYKSTKKGKSRLTRIQATSKLGMFFVGAELTGAMITVCNDTEVVILRDENKDLIAYPNSKLTNLMRKNIRNINALLDNTLIDIRLSDLDLQNMQFEMVGKKSKKTLKDQGINILDFTSKRLVRIFNNGTFKDGGRFYGGWWQGIPKKFRKHITINGKKTEEIDYSTLHPRLLYIIKGEDIPEDDFYEIEGVDKKHRTLIKKLFNAAINAKSSDKKKFINYHEKVKKDMVAPEGMTLAHLVDIIIEKHKPIEEFFFSGYGVKLQRLDSDIAERIMLKLADKEIVALPVHDSFVVVNGHNKELYRAMSETFKELTGADPKLNLQVNEGVIVASSSLRDIILSNQYSNYKQRNNDWRRQHTIDS